MTEFKVGDRVRIKDEFKPEEHRDGAEFVCEMDKYIGKDFDVDEVAGLRVISDGWAFPPDWLELVEGEEAAEDKKESILQEAQRIVNGERQADYSDPVKNFEHIARIASAILNKEITPEECCIVMIAVKHARERFKHKRDNLVDVVGYEEILYRIKEAKK